MRIYFKLAHQVQFSLHLKYYYMCAVGDGAVMWF